MKKCKAISLPQILLMGFPKRYAGVASHLKSLAVLHFKAI